MTDLSFNLTTEPWIPVLWEDGSVSEVSLREAIAKADDIRTITGDIPTQRFALHRLLLAILHRATGGPSSTKNWMEVNSHWPEVSGVVSGYLDKFRSRFDLFHPTEPFYQVADLQTAKNETFGLERLIPDVPNGRMFFTTRAGAGLGRIGAAEAARWVVHAQAFEMSGIKSGAVGDPRVKGGKGYPMGVAWAGQLGGIELLGTTLRETLMLNLIAAEHPEVSIRTGPRDLPPWERAQLTEREEPLKDQPEGFIGLYTWQSRRIRLHGSRDGVTGVVLCNGDKILPQNKQVAEPMTAWRFSEPQTKKHGIQTYMPREHNPTRMFWRGLSALLQVAPTPDAAKQPAPSLPPAVLTWAGLLRAAGATASVRYYRVHASGFVYGSQSSVIDEMIDDVLELPADLMAPDAHGLRATALAAVTHSEQAVNAIANLARNLATATGAGTTDGARDAAREITYAELDGPFRRWLTTLDPAESAESTLSRWDKEARSIVNRRSDALVSATAPDAWRGRKDGERTIDVGQSLAWFDSAMFKALPYAFEPRQETTS